MKSVFQRTIVDNAGNVVPNASVEFRLESTGTLTQTWEDREGTIPLGGTPTADANGFLQVYLTPGRYQITASDGTGSIIWRNVLIFDEVLTETLSEIIDVLHYITELTASQTVITIGSAINDDVYSAPDSIKRHQIYLNGQMLVNELFDAELSTVTGDYTVTDAATGEITLAEAAEAGDVFEYINLSIYNNQVIIVE